MNETPQQIPDQQPVEPQPQPEQQVPVQPEQPIVTPQQPPTRWLFLVLVLVIAIAAYAGMAYWKGVWPFGDNEKVVLPSPTPTSTPDKTTRAVGWQGYTEAEQSEVCDSYAGVYFNGEVITQEMGKKIVDSAENFLKEGVGEEFFNKHYKYKCDGFSSNFKHPTLTYVAFQIKVKNEELDFDLTDTGAADADIISVAVDNETLGVGISSLLLRKEALQSENWVSRDDVLDVFKSQASDEFNQKINELKSNEITIWPFLRSYSSDDGLKLYWNLTLGQWRTDFCQLYSIAVSSGEIAYEQNCSTASNEPLMK